MNSRRPMSSTGLLPQFGASASNDHQPVDRPVLPAGITSRAAVRTGLPAHAAHLVGWSGVMRTIGAISDTHGLLRPQALAALAGCETVVCVYVPKFSRRRPDEFGSTKVRLT